MKDNQSNDLLENKKDSRSRTALFIDILLGQLRGDAILNICLKTKEKGLRTSSFKASDREAILTLVDRSKALFDIYFEVCLQDLPPELGKRGQTIEKTRMIATWFDLDIAGQSHTSALYPRNQEEALEFLQALPLQPSIIIHSGNGLHSYWLLDSPWHFNTPEDNVKAQGLSRGFQRFIIGKGAERGWKLDNTSDLARLLRVPETFNHKSDPPKLVEFIHCEDKRYTLEDFNSMVPQEPERAVQVMTKDQDKIEYPPATIEPIVEHCSWMRHCKEDSAILPEPSWYRMISILGRCQNGDKLAHEWSRNYPKYSISETEGKMSQALHNSGPATCKHIFEALDGRGYCDHCPFWGFIKSPIQLGSSDELAQARFTAVKAIGDFQSSPGEIFSEENIRALSIIKERDTVAYNSIRQAYSKVGIPVKKIEQEIFQMNLEDSPAYEERGGRFIFLKQTQYGEKPIILCNFTARIVQEHTLDDGAERKKVYLIKGKTAGGIEFPEVMVSAMDFPSMNWVSINYGTTAIVEAGQAIKDHLRVAILVLSTDIRKITAFAHTGWRQIDDRWFFLTASGAISGEGLDEAVTVNLQKSLAPYDLKVPPHSVEDAFKATLRLLDLAPRKINLPLVCSIFRAPLAEFLPIDFDIFITGRSGSYKSELAALMQAHFGAGFNRLNLPGNWTSTSNMMEKMAFLLKDVIFTIDDFVPGHSHYSVADLHQKAERLIRGQGNRTGRGRMNADGSLRPTYFPRGLMVMTGEDVPKGLSLNARLLVVELRKEDVDLKVLSELQTSAASGLLAATMFYFIKWLGPQIDELRGYLEQRKVQLRDEALRMVQSHTRTPDLIASLMIGFEIFLTFGIDCQVMAEDEAVKLRDQAWEILIAVDATQKEMQIESDPVERFLSILKSAFLSGSAHLESLAGGQPTQPQLWGWKETESNQGQSSIRAQGKMIGWKDSSALFLLPDALWEVVQTIATRQNNHLTTTPITMRKRLAERKLIITKEGKNTIKKNIQSVKHRIIQMPITTLYDQSQVKSDSGSLSEIQQPWPLPNVSDIPGCEQPSEQPLIISEDGSTENTPNFFGDGTEDQAFPPETESFPGDKFVDIFLRNT